MAQGKTEISIISHNKQAMECLRRQEFDLCFSYLTKAETLLSKISQTAQPNKLYGITLNNFACFYRRTNNLPTALNFLRKALEVLAKPPTDIYHLGGTHLNICAILSQTNDHESALSHALIALNLFTNKYYEDPNIATTILVAYRNVGIEYEFLGQFSQALGIYNKALTLAVEKIGEFHPLTSSFRESLLSLSKNKTEMLNSSLRGNIFSPREDKIRQYHNSQNTIKRNTFLEKNNQKNHRFLTGERLQPMFKKDMAFSVKNPVGRKKIISSACEARSPKSQRYRKSSENGRGSTTNRLNTSENDYRSKNCKSIQTDINNYGNYNSVVYNAAVTIQKHWRSYKAKQKLKMLKYEKELENAENDAKKALDKLKIVQNKKKLFKKSNTIKKMNTKRANDSKLSINACIVFVQKFVRMWLKRKRFLKLKNAVVKIQRNVKKHQIQLLYNDIKEAIIFIQRWWRRILRRRKRLAAIQN
ncbi:hypothetical protein SteCoe_1641 [Stentor coeruleus]|uniref:Uncharacterized protein n=1 Tax=Stentor coeruleus TaxID=5963 RepID=A0A1R2D1L6_9CILI|nr:hypothetical protein SteCoe_1641 [Stentor coeruleus]